MNRTICLTLDGVRIERVLNGGVVICTTEKEWDAVTLTEEQYKALRTLIDTIDVAESCMSDTERNG